jgi:hypothetical protein
VAAALGTIQDLDPPRSVYPRTIISDVHNISSCQQDDKLASLGQQKRRGAKTSLTTELDAWMVIYDEQRTHQGRWCFGKTRCISRRCRLGARKAERRHGSIERRHDSFDPADTHRARSIVRQVKCKLLQMRCRS